MQKLRLLLILVPLVPGFAHAAELPVSEFGTVMLLSLGVLGLVVRRQMNFMRRNRQTARQEPVIESLPGQ